MLWSAECPVAEGVGWIGRPPGPYRGAGGVVAGYDAGPGGAARSYEGVCAAADDVANQNPQRHAPIPVQYVMLRSMAASVQVGSIQTFGPNTSVPPPPPIAVRQRLPLFAQRCAGSATPPGDSLRAASVCGPKSGNSVSGHGMLDPWLPR